MLTFGIVPQQSASRLAEIWVPLLRHLEARTWLGLAFATAKDIPTFEACLAKGAYDIAYMNPCHYTVFHQRSGYVAFARQAKKRLQGLLVAPKAAGIKDVSELAGREVAIPSPAAFGASVIPQAELRGRQIRITPRYVRSHDSVYRAVAAGLMLAGGGVLRTFNTLSAEIRDQLEVIYETGAYTPHAFAALGTLDPAVVDALRQAMLLSAEEAPDLLRPVGFSGFEPASDRDWDDVRALGLSSEETGILREDVDTCHSG
jgi:phosphonate transport system substrate-binding protein